MLNDQHYQVLAKYARPINQPKEPYEIHVRIRPYEPGDADIDDGPETGYPVQVQFVYLDGARIVEDDLMTAETFEAAVEFAKAAARHLRDDLKIPPPCERIRIRDETQEN